MNAVDLRIRLTVKQKTGRKRYIAARFSPAPRNKGEIWRALQSASGDSGSLITSLKLLILRDETAVLSCRHTEIVPVTSMLNGRVGQFDSETLLVSGTVRTIKKRFNLD